MKSWDEIKIKDIDTLFKHLLSYKAHWLFRGHASEKWILESTLERMLKQIGWLPEMAKACEEVALSIFQSKAHLYLAQEILPTSKLGWLSMMQHHHVPTRLLDFTESPFIALFFAFAGAETTQVDNCAIWALDYRSLMKSAIKYVQELDKSFTKSYNEVLTQQDNVFETVIDKNSYNVLWTTEPGILNLRLERQKGSFLVSGNSNRRIEELLPEFLSSDSFKKIIIPANLSNEIYNALKQMGINYSILFSDIDGLGKDIENDLFHQTSQVIGERMKD